MLQCRRTSGFARGMMTFDLVAGISLVILILVGFSLAATRLVNIQKRTVMQRQVRDAAICAISGIRAGVADPQELVRQSGMAFAQQIEIRITREPATGEWAGATRVRVEAVLDRGDQPTLRHVLLGCVYDAEGGP